MTADDGDGRPADDSADDRTDDSADDRTDDSADDRTDDSAGENRADQSPEESTDTDPEKTAERDPEEAVEGNPEGSGDRDSDESAEDSESRSFPERSGTRGSADRPNGPPRGPAGRDDSPDGIRGVVHTLRTAGGTIGIVREILSTAALVLLIGGLLFAVSGVWPPMVAIKSGSMEPHMSKGDLVFIMDDERLAGEGAVDGTGIVPHEVAEETDHQKFGDGGDVIVFRPDNQTNTDPIIHRTKFYVEEGEDWYDRADETLVDADSCEELRGCPAPNEGFITKGDNPQTNNYYDQQRGMTAPVDPEWVEGKAMVRIPALGYIRLWWGDVQHGAMAVGAVAALLLRAGIRPPRTAV